MIHAMFPRVQERMTQPARTMSGGEQAMVALARALIGEPVLLVLDEPNANLDNEGSQALNLAIRRIKSQGGAVIIMAHRPAAIAECELLLMLDRGAVRAFGPRDEVLAALNQAAAQANQQAQGARPSAPPSAAPTLAGAR